MNKLPILSSYLIPYAYVLYREGGSCLPSTVLVKAKSMEEALDKAYKLIKQIAKAEANGEKGLPVWHHDSKEDIHEEGYVIGVPKVIVPQFLRSRYPHQVTPPKTQ